MVAATDTSLAYTGTETDYTTTVEASPAEFSAVVSSSSGHTLSSIKLSTTAFTVSVEGPAGTLTPILDMPVTEADSQSIGELLMNLELLFLEGGALDVDFFKQLSDMHRREVQASTKKTIDSFAESLDKAGSAKKGGAWAKAFSWVATVVTCIAAVVMVAATFGAATPAAVMMCAAATLMLVNQISSETGNWLQKGMTEMCGGNEMAGMIVFMVIVLALSLGGAGIGAATSGVKAATTASTVSKATIAGEEAALVASAAGKAPAVIRAAKEAAYARVVGEEVTALEAKINSAIFLATRAQLITSVAGSGASIAAGVTHYNYMMSVVDLQEARAGLAKIQEIFAEISQALIAAIQSSMTAADEQSKITKAYRDALSELFHV